MAGTDPLQVSMVGSSPKDRYWAKRSNIPKKVQKTLKAEIFHTHTLRMLYKKHAISFRNG